MTDELAFTPGDEKWTAMRERPMPRRAMHPTFDPDPIGDDLGFEERFQVGGEWDGVGGSIQSLIFSSYALRLLTVEYRHLAEYIVRQGPLVDYGCALGDGTALISAYFQGVPVIGCDLSATAVRRSSERWPTLQFQVDDIRRPTIKAHCIWTSHTIEHLKNPLRALRRLQAKCRILVAIFPKVDETTTTGPHTGAPFTRAWLPKMEHPLAGGSFTTPRLDVTNGSMLQEDSLFYVWRGHHK